MVCQWQMTRQPVTGVLVRAADGKGPYGRRPSPAAPGASRCSAASRPQSRRDKAASTPYRPCPAGRLVSGPSAPPARAAAPGRRKEWWRQIAAR